ncbi:hypothetical protein R1sor_003552 [Riccia sorocarpa]|uniref:DDE Tnp4 domain-containing protein n=1 Tax=Riccia sorocarpa TaxID=122646 RepID=A0ABD3H1W7_9MARC
MPGSCRDFTCLRRSSLWGRLNSPQLFDFGQYLLADSGYVPLERLVCSYKRTGGDMDKAGVPLHFKLYTEEDDDNYMRWKWISKKEARRVLRGIDPQLLVRFGLNDALPMDWSRPEEETEFVKEFVLNWDDNAQRSTVDGEIIPLNVNVIREVFGLEEGRSVPRSARQYEDLCDWVPERSKTAKTWFANDVFMPEWRPIIQLINMVLLGKQKPLKVTGAFIYILKNKVAPASLNEDLDWASYFQEKIRKEIKACRKQMMAAGKRKIRPTCIGIVILLHILRVRGIADDGQLVRSDSNESVESAGDRATNTTTSADSLVRNPQGGAADTITSANNPVRSPQGGEDCATTFVESPVRSPHGGQDRTTTSADIPVTSPQGVQDGGSPGDGRSSDLVGDEDPQQVDSTAERGQGDDVGVLEISPATADVDDIEVAESLRSLRGHSRGKRPHEVRSSQRKKWADERIACVNNMEALARRERSVTPELSTLGREWGYEKKQLNTKIEELKFALDTAAKVRQTSLLQEEKQSLLNEIEVLRFARDNAAQSRVNNGQQDETQKLLKEIEDLRSAAASAARQREEEKNRWDRARRLLVEDKLLLIKESKDLRSAAEIKKEKKTELERSKKLAEEDRQKLGKEIEDLFAASANVAWDRDEKRKQWDSTKAQLMEQIRDQDPELNASHLNQLKQDSLKLENEIRVLEEVSVLRAFFVCAPIAVWAVHEKLWLAELSNAEFTGEEYTGSFKRPEVDMADLSEANRARFELVQQKGGGCSHADAKLLEVQCYGTR